MTSRTALWVFRLGLVASMVAIAYRALLVERHFVDDVFIFLRYARNLAESGELAFSSGERVEGFSSVSWQLGLGLLWRLGGQGIGWAKGLSLVITTLLPPASAWATRRHFPTRPLLWLLAPWAIALDADMGCWGASGMDAPLFALACILAVGACSSLKAGAFALGSLAWVRPEGPWIAAFGLGALMLAHAPSRKNLPGAIAWFAVPMAALLVLRYGYFREVLPNTFFAKMGDAGGTDYDGWGYLVSALTRRPALYGLAVGLPIVALMTRTTASRTVLVPSSILLAIFLFAFLASGDWMPNRRLLLPSLPVAALGIALSLGTIFADSGRVPGFVRILTQRHLRALESLFAFGLLVEAAFTTNRALDQTWRSHERLDERIVSWHLAERPLRVSYGIHWGAYHLLEVLAPYVRGGDTVAHVDMGQLPYLMRDVGFLDGFGLVDRISGRAQYRPQDAARLREARDHFFSKMPAAAVVVVDERRGGLPFSHAQRAFTADPDFEKTYRELTRFPTWGAHPCIVYVRRDRIPSEPAETAARKASWLSAARDMHTP